MNRCITTAIVLLLACLPGMGQSKYNNQIQPGLNTRADVDAVLGQPVRAINANRFEYPPPAGASRLTVLYRNGSNVVDLIQLEFPKTSRASMLQALKLPDQPDATAITEGHLVEYFGAEKFLSLGYAGADTSSEVTTLGYYSRELYQADLRPIRGNQAAAGANASAPNPTGAGASPPNATGPSPAGSGGSAPGLSARPSATPATPANDADFRVKLLTPINTQTSKKGDKITAQVLDPAAFRGDILEGTVRESKSGAKLKGKSVLNFTFNTLNHGGQALPVQANVKSLVNSKGQQDVDEEGQVIRKKNSLGKVAGVTAVGALLGGLTGGAQGAAIGAGVGAAAALIVVEVATEAPNVSFAPGSELVLSLRSAAAPQQ